MPSNFEKIAKAAKDFACGIYKNQPGALIPNPVSDVLYLAWDNFCDYPASPGLPAPPTAPFQGGQCDCVVYLVEGQMYFSKYDVTLGLNTTSWWGPIGGVRTGNSEQRGKYAELLCRGSESGGACREYTWYPWYQSGAGTELYPTTATITKITRKDGGVDTCGNPPSSFPSAPPVPPGGYTSPPTNIIINNGDNITVRYNFNPPYQPNPLNFVPPIVINYIKPEINLKIPIEFHFNGDVNFGGDGGVLSDEDRDTLNQIKNNTNNLNNTTNNINVNLNNVNTTINNEINNSRNRKRPDTDFEVPPPPKPPGKHEQEYLEAVEIRLLAVPKNAKKQLGKGAPDILYAGWFEFQRKGKSLPRDPIHFEGSVFKAPEGVDGYAYTLYTGYTGEALEIINKPIE